MADALRHRGPDGEGVEVLGPAALSHRRLAVIDLSEAGRQPLSNEDGTVWLTFNGEIYNYRALRDDLIARGHSFRSQTDSEVIVHLYEERGADLVTALRGMFAFALWDARAGRLLLARDRVGQKPLHYHLDDDALRFASEPLALFAGRGGPTRAVDPVGIVHYLHYGWVPAPHSAFRGVRKLPPGHLLEWEPGGAPRLRRYWRPELLPKLEVSAARDEEALCEQLAARLEESVRLRLVADVPLGAFLSGGIDSGLVVAAMAGQLDQAVRTFTVGFPGAPAGHDERARADLVARRFATRHTEDEVALDAQEALPTLLQRYGEPFADPSAVPTYRVSEVARRDVTVVLTGEAGDELFAGYGHHAVHDPGWLLTWRAGALGGPARALIDRLPRRWARRALRAVEGARALPFDPARASAERLMKVPRTAVALMLRPELAEQVRGLDVVETYSRRFHEVSATCRAERSLWADLNLYLPDALLTKVDVASMAHGLEARAPFLDHPLVEWALRLPISTKLRWGTTKWLPRRLAARRLPPAIAAGPKRGFSIPQLSAWFQGPLVGAFRELVLAPDARCRALIDVRVAEQLLDLHTRGRADYQYSLWTLYWLERWLREVVEAG
jgi:asparagine synthase (glutamine-hydrolysing)